MVTIARALLLLALASASLANERVVLQLKWEPQFQFAGYYAALWQGYYAAAGLEVEIVPVVDEAGRFRNVKQELLEGRADFAIGGSDILVGRDQGHPLVVLAPIFQRSPGALVTLADLQLRSLRDLSGLRIAVNPNDFIARELQALIAARVNRAEPPVLVSEPLTLKTLQSGKADVLLTYGISAEYEAKEAGLEVHSLAISDIEPAFFGDTLYTHQRVINRSPDRVRRFLEASLQGWHYAMTHKEEMIERIAALPRQFNPFESLEGYNRFFADNTNSLLYYPHIPLGFNEPQRWRQMHRLLSDAGLLQAEYPGSELHFRIDRPDTAPKTPWLALVLLGGGLVLAVLLIRLPGRYSLPLAAAGIVIALAYALEVQLKERHQDLQHKDVWSQLASIRVQLEGRINGQFALLRGVVGLIASEPDLDQKRFSEFVGGLIDQDPLLVNVAAAPNLVVRHVYPLAGNEKAVGLDYRTNAEQLPMVELARDLRRMIVAGPLELVQGGRAIIGRAPVYLSKPGADSFWGIVSAPVDFDRLIDDVGLNAPNLGLEIAIRHGRLAWAVNSEPLIYGDIDVFDREPVSMQVSLGAVEWEIAALPKGGWRDLPTSLAWYWPTALGLALTLGLALYLALRQFSARLQISNEFKRNEGLLRRVSQSADVGGWEIDLRSGCEYVTDEVYLLHGTTPDAGKGASPTRWFNFYDDASRNLIRARIREAIDTGEIQDFEVMVERDDGSPVWLRHIVEPARSDGRITHLHGVVQDISPIRQADKTIQYHATTDPVTGLPNRLQFSQRLAAALASPRGYAYRIAVLFIDLDHFKDINDSLGHGVGDQLLKSLGQRFSAMLRDEDVVARLGGDEFTVMLPGITDADSCTRVAQEIIALAQEPIIIDEHEVHITASVGISLFPQDASDVETLLRHADQAMYAAKAAGRNTARYFTASMQEDVDRRHKLHMQLATALKERELSVFYQPIVDVRSGEIVKCEALARWGDISPQEFISLAEDTGLIGELGEFVMLRACEDVAAINAETGRTISMAFNKSTREFVEESRTHSSVLEQLREQELFPNITVEITENLLMQESSETIDHLMELRKAGLKIAIDDFGTGYSSLSYLQKFPVDIVKIDKSFICDIEGNGDARSLVRAIISMAQSLRLNVVAEGVETAGQLAILRQLNCDYVQGYYYSPPLPRDKFIQYLRNYNRFSA
ncbi:EAL domain-containing protein [Litorivivens sp.]|uniref:EAL domain-containing protein n=1 Tax=Litorivivens sp. TaxID=2020868 RepID=UPI003565F8E8